MNQNQPPMSSQPTPPTNPVLQTNPNVPTKKPMSSTKIILIVVGSIIGFIVIIGIVMAIAVSSSLGSAKKKATDAKIKSDVQQASISLTIFHDMTNSYVGWTPDQQLTSSIQTDGSKFSTQSLTKDNYVVYAKISDGKSIFCMDSTGFRGELSAISPNQKSCQK